MNFNLKGNRFDLTNRKHFHNKLCVEIRKTQMLTVSFFNTFFHVLPILFEWSMSPFISISSHISDRPVYIVQINISKLHQTKSFFELIFRIQLFMIECFSGDEQLLTFYTTFLHNHFESFPKLNFVIVIASSINMSAIAQC